MVGNLTKEKLRQIKDTVTNVAQAMHGLSILLSKIDIGGDLMLNGVSKLIDAQVHLLMEASELFYSSDKDRAKIIMQKLKKVEVEEKKVMSQLKNLSKKEKL